MTGIAATLLCLGAGPEQLPAIERARALGCRVVAVDVDPDAVGFARCSDPRVVDVSDYEAVLGLAAAARVDGVLPAPIGRHVVLAGLVNDALGLVGPGAEVCERCADKRRFGELTGRGGRPLEPDEALSPDVPPLAPPFVVKPARGAGGRGVHRIGDAGDWAVWCAVHAAEEHPGGVLLEPFCPGEPHGVDAIVRNGRVHVALLRGKRLDFSHGILETAHHTFGTAGSPRERRVEATLQALVDALGYRDGLLHADLVIDDDAVHVVEMSPRPSGLHLSSHLLPASTGVDFLGLGIRQVRGEPFELAPSHAGCWALQYLALGPGRVEALPGREAREALPAIREWRIGVAVGERLDAPTTLRTLLSRGHLLARGDSPTTVLSRVDEALATFEIR